jgi:hypothetical protein
MKSFSLGVNHPQSHKRARTTATTQFIQSRTKWSHLLFVPFLELTRRFPKALVRRNLSVSERVPGFIYDRRNRENFNMKNKSRYKHVHLVDILARSKVTMWYGD